MKHPDEVYEERHGREESDDYVKEILAPVVPQVVRDAIRVLEDAIGESSAAGFGCGMEEQSEDSPVSHLVTIEFEIPRE